MTRLVLLLVAVVVVASITPPLELPPLPRAVPAAMPYPGEVVTGAVKR